MGNGRFGICEPFYAVLPVSYTHLDVYKRQVLTDDDDNGDVLVGMFSGMTLAIAIMPGPVPKIGRASCRERV